MEELVAQKCIQLVTWNHYLKNEETEEEKQKHKFTNVQQIQNYVPFPMSTH